METIRKDFVSPAHVKKITDAYKTLYGQAPKVRLIGAFLVNAGGFGDLIHLDRHDHEVVDITRNYIMVQVHAKFYRIQREFDLAVEKPVFIIEH